MAETRPKNYPKLKNYVPSRFMLPTSHYKESDEAFSQITIGAYKLGAMIKVSEELLNDSIFDIQSYLANGLILYHQLYRVPNIMLLRSVFTMPRPKGSKNKIKTTVTWLAAVALLSIIDALYHPLLLLQLSSFPRLHSR